MEFHALEKTPTLGADSVVLLATRADRYVFIYDFSTVLVPLVAVFALSVTPTCGTVWAEPVIPSLYHFVPICRFLAGSTVEVHVVEAAFTVVVPIMGTAIVEVDGIPTFAAVSEPVVEAGLAIVVPI